MSVRRKPKSNTNDTQSSDALAEHFISGNTQTEAKPATPEGQGKTAISLRFDRDLLSRIDAAAKQSGISRSAWITYDCAKALDE